MKFRVLDGCPCPDSIAPYIYVVLREAGQVASSIYRGEDAAALLHAHGKRTQAEIHRDLPAISNPPGFSEHELRSDGVGKPYPRGSRIPEWMQGVDSGGNSQEDRDRVSAAARKHGFSIVHHYSSGVEGHHWCFERQPRVFNPVRVRRIHKLRKSLPTR